jgi:hypothetical protein
MNHRIIENSKQIWDKSQYIPTTHLSENIQKIISTIEDRFDCQYTGYVVCFGHFGLMNVIIQINGTLYSIYE